VPDDAQEVRFRPSIDLPTGSSGLLTYHPNRTAVTLRTAAGSFSFAPKDLEAGEPILIPSLGFLVSKVGSHQSATGYVRQTAAKKLRTIASASGKCRAKSRARPGRAIHDEPAALSAP